MSIGADIGADMGAALIGLVLSFTDPAGQVWCGRVSQVDTGPGGIQYAWLVVAEPPQWIQHEPVRNLRECKS